MKDNESKLSDLRKENAQSLEKISELRKELSTCKAEADFTLSEVKFSHDIELKQVKDANENLTKDIADRQEKIRELNLKVKDVQNSVEASISEVQ